jgi:hypothetical protein
VVERLFRAQESVVKGLTDRIEELEEEAMLDADHESFQDEEDSNTRDTGFQEILAKIRSLGNNKENSVLR